MWGRPHLVDHEFFQDGFHCVFHVWCFCEWVSCCFDCQGADYWIERHSWYTPRKKARWIMRVFHEHVRGFSWDWRVKYHTGRHIIIDFGSPAYCQGVCQQEIQRQAEDSYSDRNIRGRRVHRRNEVCRIGVKIWGRGFDRHSVGSSICRRALIWVDVS